MDIEIINKYFFASELFNKQNEKYNIRVFIDFDFLIICVDDTKNNTIYPFKILLPWVKDLSIDDILKSYNELVEKINKR